MEKIDTSKLTKKVQEYIKYLEREIDDLEKLNKHLRKEQEESNIYYCPSHRPERFSYRVHIPNNQTITFDLTGEDTMGSIINISLIDGMLRIHGGTAISVFPRASNAIEIKTIR